MKTNETYGACAKHPYQNMVDCPECAMEHKLEKEPIPEWMEKMFDNFFKNDVPRLNSMYLHNWVEFTLWLQDQAYKGKTEFRIEIIHPTGKIHQDSIKITCGRGKPLILKNYLD